MPFHMDSKGPNSGLLRDIDKSNGNIESHTYGQRSGDRVKKR